MKKIATLLMLVLGMAFFTGGCSQSQSNINSKYIGKWITLETSEWDNSTKIIRQLEIVKNGDNFIIKDIVTIPPSDKPKIDSKSATLTKDGKLQVSPMDVYTFVESDNTLLWNVGITYKKEIPEELARVKKEAAEISKK